MTCDDTIKYLKKLDEWTLEYADSFSTCRETCPMAKQCETLGHALCAANIKRIPR